MRSGLVPGVAAVAAVVLAGSACGGPGTAPGPPGRSPGSAGCLGAQRMQCVVGSASPVTVTVPSPRPTTPPPWPEHGMVLAEGNDPPLAFGSQVLDPAAGVLYALVPTSVASPSARDVLEAIDLRTGRVRRGASYRADGLALASGLLWVSVYSGPGGHPELAEASPATLATIRSVPLPGSPGLAWSVAAGPPGSVWAGAGRTLLRVSASTGIVLARAVLPAGLQLTAVAAGPGGASLYAAALRLPPRYGAVVLEYSAGAGRLVAQSGAGTLRWSVGGASLTAVPGGVWTWFRTGMMGQSGLLRARSLSVAGGFPTTFSTADSPATGIGTVYDWAMGSDSAYGGGTLWVATSPGLLACVNPDTGRVRAQETLTPGQALGVYAMAADRAAGRLVAVISTVSNTTGATTVTLETITPPRDCWG
ncbi:MAG TPA: hypothetical protein VME19_08760 [Streptosporangiaceae bacterium]|nr:hypothetical protein [Streptosporangiaceae bacterium]